MKNDGLPRPLPLKVVNSWTDAGAEVGWMQAKEPDYFKFLSRNIGIAEAIPAFRFRFRQQSMSAELPDPGTPFGLVVSSVTDAGLKELAGLKSLQSLSLHNTQVTDAGLKELAGLKACNH